MMRRGPEKRKSPGLAAGALLITSVQTPSTQREHACSLGREPPYTVTTRQGTTSSPAGRNPLQVRSAPPRGASAGVCFAPTAYFYFSAERQEMGGEFILNGELFPGLDGLRHLEDG